jgi:hypothetical protein
MHLPDQSHTRYSVATLIYQVILALLTVFPVITANAQQQGISLHAENKSLQQIIDELTTNYRFRFAYSSDHINLQQKVSADFRQISPETAIRKIFNNTGIAYSMEGMQVILYRDPNQRFTISGKVREQGSGELLIGVIINSIPARSGAVSNGYGFYSITLPADTYTIQFNYVGFKPLTRTVVLDGSATLDIELEAASNLEEVVVKERAADRERTLNAIEVPLKEITQVPMILGEKDVVKYIMLMPGLQKGNEGNSNMYVRGGGPDQNLIMIDDAVIYNAYHYLGLSSLFSGSELRNAELIKGGFSSKYGGRLSSVLSMSLKDGNREKFGGEATLGVISSRLQLEGPIQKGKSSFFISARKSYIDQVSRVLVKSEDDQLDYAYYDLHGKLSTDIGKKDRIMLSGYMGQDMLGTSGNRSISPKDDGIIWGNRAATLRWNHQYTGKLFSNTSLVYSYYRSRVAFSEFNNDGTTTSSVMQSTINDYTVKYDLDYLPGEQQRIRAGAGFTRHQFSPIASYGRISTSTNVTRMDSYSADEAFAYGEYGLHLLSGLSVTPGIRLSFYDRQVSYLRAEPRLNIVYQLKKNWSVNAAYDLMNQYIHMISSFSGLGFPTDTWTSSDAQLKPQRAHVISAGVFKKQILNSGFSMGVEGYYKQISHIAVMREGSSFIQLMQISGLQRTVENWNQLLTQGNCTSYGTEMQLKKEGTRFSGWISYTLSKTTIQADAVNRGNPYPATYDRRHDLGIYLNYKTARHFAFSANWVFGTGNAVTLPSGEFFNIQNDTYLVSEGKLYDYDSKNSFRMKPYHRLDISAQYHHTITRWVESTIELSVYNVYNRANPFFYQISNENTENFSSRRILKQISLFPVMPSLSWTLKF